MTSEPEPTPTRAPGRARSVARGLVALGPHRGAHRVAIRAGVSVLVPLLALVLLGHVEWTAYAAFGAFTSLYGRNHARPERAGMQAVAGGFLTLAVTFGFAVSAMVPATPATVPLAAGIAALSGLFSMFVAQVGVLREPASWSPPVLPVPRFRDALAPPGAVTHLVRYVVALAVAGSVATSLDWQLPYWAMVAAVVVLSGPDLLSRLTRGVQRVVGTLLGLVVAAVVLVWHPQGVTTVLAIVVLQ